MLTRRSAIRLILILSIAAIVQNFYYWLHLPDRVAIHFNADGNADNWASRDTATILMLVLQIGFPLLFLNLIAFVSKLPNSMINVPHRDYWLAPERRDRTLQDMAQSLSAIAVAGSVFLLVLNHFTFTANRAKGKLAMAPFAVLVILFVVTVLIIAGRMTLRYRHVPDQD